MRGAGRKVYRRELEPSGELQRPGEKRLAARLQHVARFRRAAEHFDGPHSMRLRSPTHPRHRILDESHVQRAPVPRREEIVRIQAVAIIARRNRVDVGTPRRERGRTDRRRPRRADRRAAGRPRHGRRRRRRADRRRPVPTLTAAGDEPDRQHERERHQHDGIESFHRFPFSS